MRFEKDTVHHGNNRGYTPKTPVHTSMPLNILCRKVTLMGEKYEND
jgi:hypothetical protein